MHQVTLLSGPTPPGPETEAIFLPWIGAPQPPSDACGMSARSFELFQMIRHAPGQQRNPDDMQCHPLLVKAAQRCIERMKATKHFAHVVVDEDGQPTGPNWIVMETGYRLPNHYGQGRDDNNGQDLNGNQSNVHDALNGWLLSPPHRAHILGEHESYLDQTCWGLADYYKDNSGIYDDQGMMIDAIWVAMGYPLPAPVIRIADLPVAAG